MSFFFSSAEHLLDSRQCTAGMVSVDAGQQGGRLQGGVHPPHNSCYRKLAVFLFVGSEEQAKKSSPGFLRKHVGRISYPPQDPLDGCVCALAQDWSKLSSWVQQGASCDAAGAPLRGRPRFDPGDVPARTRVNRRGNRPGRDGLG